MKPHHIGYLVKNMDKSILEFLELGYIKESEVTYDPYRDINICFLTNQGLRVELVSPVSSKSVVADMMKKRGASPYHICYQVEDISVSSEMLRLRGYLPMGEAMPAPAIHNVQAVFYYHRAIGIVELISYK